MKEFSDEWRETRGDFWTEYVLRVPGAYKRNRLRVVSYEPKYKCNVVEWYAGKDAHWDEGMQGGPATVSEEWMELNIGVNKEGKSYIKLTDGWRSRIGCIYQGTDSFETLMDKAIEAYRKGELPSLALDYPSDLWKGSIFLRNHYCAWMVAHSHRTFGIDYDRELYELGVKELS